jgi:hypothetical protein
MLVELVCTAVAIHVWFLVTNGMRHGAMGTPLAQFDAQLLALFRRRPALRQKTCHFLDAKQ